MKILVQFQKKSEDEDLRKLSILRAYCDEHSCIHDCIACYENFVCCSLTYRECDPWPDDRIEGKLPYEWQTPEHNPEYEEEDLREAIKWWRELIQTDNYREYSKYIQ